ncbi:glycine cleavage system protein H, partial [candidate division KSB1 bacterium]|nr:glycine cleavage system protein H [candidate division KSB1 bacterium]
MNIPANLLYTKEHEWVKIEGEVATIGITDYAQGQLGDIVFVELPALGAETKQMQPFGTIEAV